MIAIFRYAREEVATVGKIILVAIRKRFTPIKSPVGVTVVSWELATIGQAVFIAILERFARVENTIFITVLQRLTIVWDTILVAIQFTSIRKTVAVAIWITFIGDAVDVAVARRAAVNFTGIWNPVGVAVRLDRTGI